MNAQISEKDKQASPQNLSVASSLAKLRWPFSIEKWYIDTLLPDGSVMLLYLGRLYALGFTMQQITAEFFRPGQPTIRGDATAQQVVVEPNRLRFGSAIIEPGRVQFSTPGLSGDLDWNPRNSPVTLRNPFINQGSRQLKWCVEVPDACVRGRLWWPGGEILVNGRGYRDRVFFDLIPWKFPIKQLIWGRAVGEHHAAIWVEAQTNSGKVLASWQDGEIITEQSPAVELGASRLLLKTSVVDLEGIHLGMLKPLMRRILSDPYEIKWAASATLVDEPAVAVHEVVRWL